MKGAVSRAERWWQLPARYPCNGRPHLVHATLAPQLRDTVAVAHAASNWPRGSQRGNRATARMHTAWPRRETRFGAQPDSRVGGRRPRRRRRERPIRRPAWKPKQRKPAQFPEPLFGIQVGQAQICQTESACRHRLTYSLHGILFPPWHGPLNTQTSSKVGGTVFPRPVLRADDSHSRRTL